MVGVYVCLAFAAIGTACIVLLLGDALCSHVQSWREFRAIQKRDAAIAKWLPLYTRSENKRHG